MKHSTCPGTVAPVFTRRGFLQQASAGFGMLALNGLFSREAGAAAPHFAARAKNVIFCFMDGGPSHVDTFDYKPVLKKHQGQTLDPKWLGRRTQGEGRRVWMGSPWEFRQRGQSGL